MRIGTTELLLILALAILLFGGSRLAGLGKSLGKGIKEFRQEMKDGSKEEKTETKESNGSSE
ncbi:MAG: twin-arginine translocase TatA/TatE family subunit [Spirochaetaceae bacterium]|nr:twin-arginine translocase TatA/TatE family subunit [Spirochaetaceae bacterium]MBO5730007.1 twin-arginine translocase TatA/TatE family subunit [Treponema sp.]